MLYSPLQWCCTLIASILKFWDTVFLSNLFTHRHSEVCLWRCRWWSLSTCLHKPALITKLPGPFLMARALYPVSTSWRYWTDEISCC